MKIIDLINLRNQQVIKEENLKQNTPLQAVQVNLMDNKYITDGTGEMELLVTGLGHIIQMKSVQRLIHGKKRINLIYES